MSGLPSGYTQLEYIQSSGTQYINTGFKPNQNSRAVLDFQLTAITGAWQGILSARDGAANAYGNNFSLWATASNTYRTDFGTDGGPTFGAVNTERHFLDKNKAIVSIDDVTATNAAAVFSCNFPLCIGTGYTGGASEYPAMLKIYACQIYDNGTLVRDFVPCKNDSSAVGLYDTVEGQFYANAGTGSFTAGPEIIIDPPSAPTGLQTVLAVVLQWAASENADRYDVYRDGAKLGSTEATQYVDTTPEPNETYVYTVKAVNDGGESAGASITVYTKSGYFEYKPLIESANFP